uniref:Sushi domain-containing protein n=1 Tax=Chromera velia CCMP2878 TaxID=1169474 RepID=A0A0G4F8R5_9ALVE|eukprot:Cvel_2958.t1-p1 / transcript=Cvel_2958.t1 / gene=Cvel_2958 / organism=Chromera_velia_CCMP2878 / gene_product=hypothetical protein / transcript_product=hypothetical protein / location=Cvel_scaffold117:40816-54682(+) / protein_length=2169 / sequence_SO=supercontig / SO=protein_coding / is_pseudo=false
MLLQRLLTGADSREGKEKDCGMQSQMQAGVSSSSSSNLKGKSEDGSSKKSPGEDEDEEEEEGTSMHSNEDGGVCWAGEMCAKKFALKCEGLVALYVADRQSAALSVQQTSEESGGLSVQNWADRRGSDCQSAFGSLTNQHADKLPSFATTESRRDRLEEQNASSVQGDGHAADGDAIAEMVFSDDDGVVFSHGAWLSGERSAPLSTTESLTLFAVLEGKPKKRKGTQPEGAGDSSIDPQEEEFQEEEEEEEEQQSRGVVFAFTNILGDTLELQTNPLGIRATVGGEELTFLSSADLGEEGEQRVLTLSFVGGYLRLYSDGFSVNLTPSPSVAAVSAKQMAGGDVSAGSAGGIRLGLDLRGVVDVGCAVPNVTASVGAHTLAVSLASGSDCFSGKVKALVVYDRPVEGGERSDLETLLRREPSKEAEDLKQRVQDVEYIVRFADCGPLHEPGNGHHVIQPGKLGSTTREQATAVFQCDDGFLWPKQFPAFSICTEFGHWLGYTDPQYQPVPNCVPEDACELHYDSSVYGVDFDDVDVANVHKATARGGGNGGVNGTSSNATLTVLAGRTVSLSCKGGPVLSADPRLRCDGPSGGFHTYLGIPVDQLPTCTKSCTVPSDVQDGSRNGLRVRGIEGARVDVGAHIKFWCPPRRKVFPEEFHLHAVNCTVDPVSGLPSFNSSLAEVTCLPDSNSCGEPESPTLTYPEIPARMTGGSSSLGSSAIFGCPPVLRYKIAGGAPVLHCGTNGKWNGTLPVCTPELCEDDGYVLSKLFGDGSGCHELSEDFAEELGGFCDGKATLGALVDAFEERSGGASALDTLGGGGLASLEIRAVCRAYCKACGDLEKPAEGSAQSLDGEECHDDDYLLASLGDGTSCGAVEATEDLGCSATLGAVARSLNVSESSGSLENRRNSLRVFELCPESCAQCALNGQCVDSPAVVWEVAGGRGCGEVLQSLQCGDTLGNAFSVFRIDKDGHPLPSGPPPDVPLHHPLFLYCRESCKTCASGFADPPRSPYFLQKPPPECRNALDDTLPPAKHGASTCESIVRHSLIRCGMPLTHFLNSTFFKSDVRVREACQLSCDYCPAPETEPAPVFSVSPSPASPCEDAGALDRGPYSCGALTHGSDSEPSRFSICGASFLDLVAEGDRYDVVTALSNEGREVGEATTVAEVCPSSCEHAALIVSGSSCGEIKEKGECNDQTGDASAFFVAAEAAGRALSGPYAEIGRQSSKAICLCTCAASSPAPSLPPSESPSPFPSPSLEDGDEDEAYSGAGVCADEPGLGCEVLGLAPGVCLKTLGEVGAATAEADSEGEGGGVKVGVERAGLLVQAVCKKTCGVCDGAGPGRQTPTAAESATTTSTEGAEPDSQASLQAPPNKTSGSSQPVDAGLGPCVDVSVGCWRVSIEECPLSLHELGERLRGRGETFELIFPDADPGRLSSLGMAAPVRHLCAQTCGVSACTPAESEEPGGSSGGEEVVVSASDGSSSGCVFPSVDTEKFSLEPFWSGADGQQISYQVRCRQGYVAHGLPEGQYEETLTCDTSGRFDDISFFCDPADPTEQCSSPEAALTPAFEIVPGSFHMMQAEPGNESQMITVVRLKCNEPRYAPAEGGVSEEAVGCSAGQWTSPETLACHMVCPPWTDRHSYVLSVGDGPVSVQPGTEIQLSCASGFVSTGRAKVLAGMEDESSPMKTTGRAKCVDGEWDVSLTCVALGRFGLSTHPEVATVTHEGIVVASDPPMMQSFFTVSLAGSSKVGASASNSLDRRIFSGESNLAESALRLYGATKRMEVDAPQQYLSFDKTNTPVDVLALIHSNELRDPHGFAFDMGCRVGLAGSEHELTDPHDPQWHLSEPPAASSMNGMPVASTDHDMGASEPRLVDGCFTGAVQVVWMWRRELSGPEVAAAEALNRNISAALVNGTFVLEDVREWLSADLSDLSPPSSSSATDPSSSTPTAPFSDALWGLFVAHESLIDFAAPVSNQISADSPPPSDLSSTRAPQSPSPSISPGGTETDAAGAEFLQQTLSMENQLGTSRSRMGGEKRDRRRKGQSSSKFVGDGRKVVRWKNLAPLLGLSSPTAASSVDFVQQATPSRQPSFSASTGVIFDGRGTFLSSNKAVSPFSPVRGLTLSVSAGATRLSGAQQVLLSFFTGDACKPRSLFVGVDVGQLDNWAGSDGCG